MKTFTKCQLPCGTSASPPRCGRTATAVAEPSCAAEPFAAATAATAAAEPCAAEPCAAEPSAAAAPPPPPPSPAPPRLSPPPSPAPPSPAPRRALRRHPASLPDRCSLPCLATRSTALAADLLKFDKANRKAAGPNTRRVDVPPRTSTLATSKTARRAGPQLSVKRQYGGARRRHDSWTRRRAGAATLRRLAAGQRPSRCPKASGGWWEVLGSRLGSVLPS